MRYLSFDPGVRNLSYSKLTINAETITNMNFGVFDLTRGKKVKQCSFEQIVDNLFIDLDTLTIDDVDMILIENQMSMVNPMAKSMSIAMYAYFKTKGKTAKLIAPSRKLSSKEKNKLSYRERKAESVRMCFNMISKEDKLELMKYKKQDDISDTITMAKAYNDDVLTTKKNTKKSKADSPKRSQNKIEK